MIDPEDILLLAAHTGLVGDVELGLKKGASPNLVDESGYSVLHLAALSNHPGVVRLLTERGAELETTDDNGFTPLQLAVDEKRYVSAQALIIAGANVDVAWPDKSSSLHKFASDDRWSLMDDAIQSGANVQAQDAAGQTPIQIAAVKGYERSVRTLLTSGAEVSDLKGMQLPPEVAKVVRAWRAGQALLEH